jgi:hypothetical protein
MHIDVEKLFHVTDSTIRFVAYALFFLGVWFVCSPYVISLFRRTINNSRFRTTLRHQQENKSELEEHIKMLINIVFNSRSDFSYYTFYTISGTLFFVALLVLSRKTSFAYTVFYSIAAAFLPYGYLRLKLTAIRIEGSYQAEQLIVELLNQYKISYLNMIEAIDRTIPFLEEYPYVQRMLFRLSLRVKEYRTKEELQNIIKEFTYASETEWATLLAHNLYLSIEDGTDVTEALEDIVEELRETKQMLEETKRMNNETFFMIQFLSPGLYVLSIWGAVKYFDFTFKKFLDYQLNTPAGLKTGILILVLTVINFVALTIMKKQKFDF